MTLSQGTTQVCTLSHIRETLIHASASIKQQTLTGFEKYGKTTRRARFLAHMERIIPWPEMTAAAATVYPEISELGGRPPIPLERMLLILVAMASSSEFP
jgi:hypothetical protein